MEEKYIIELSFAELNNLICHGLWAGQSCMEKLIKSNPENSTSFKETLQMLESTEIKIKLQMRGQGNTVI